MFKSKLEVELTDFSREFVEKPVYEYYGYEKVDHIEEVDKKCVIHMRPRKDTYESDKNDELYGYSDAVIFDIEIYDVENKKYCLVKHFDNIDIIDVDTQIRYFKDLSTMIICRNVTLYGLTNTLSVYNTSSIKAL